MEAFTLITSDLLFINIMEKDFPEKPSPQDIEPTKSNDVDTMIHPTSSISSPSILEASSTNNASPTSSTVGSPVVGKPVDPNHFPTHLYKMLQEIDHSEGAASETVEGRTFANIVSWQPHGKCFLIHDEDLFSKSVLPKYFCRLKFTSFQRQLHFHGFKRLCKQGPDKGAYYHDLFTKGMPEVATYIQRIKSTKGLRGRKRKSQDQEPDFYKLPPPSMAAMIAKAKRTVTNASPEPPKLSLQMNEVPLPSHTNDATGMVRLEPTPIGQMRSVQASNILPFGEYQQDVRANEVLPNKRQRQDNRAAAPTSSEESKFNVGVVQQLLQQGGAGRSELLDLSGRSGSVRTSLSAMMGSSHGASTGNDDDMWPLPVGMLYGGALTDRGDLSMSLGQPNMPSLALPPVPQDLEPTPIRNRQEQPPPHQGQSFLAPQGQQQQYDAEDQLQQQILRQIDEQQRQLLQQRQQILQRQQLQMQQRQMNSMHQGQQDASPMPQPQQPLGASDRLNPFQQQQQDEQQLARMGNLHQRRNQQSDLSPHHLQRYSKQG